MTEPYTIHLVDPCVVLWDGTTHRFLFDGVREVSELPPVERAVTVARLRALADVLEGSA